jgi:uncharacterized membrane protein YkgB
MSTETESESSEEVGWRARPDEMILRVGEFVLRYGLVVVIGWIGILKFWPYEAQAIAAYTMNSPLTSWLYAVFSVQAAAIVFGIWEIIAAVLIAIRPLSARLSALGSAMAVLQFLVTLSFFLTTPGIWHASLGFPALSGAPGQFLLKDLILLGAAVWTLGEAFPEDSSLLNR